MTQLQTQSKMKDETIAEAPSFETALRGLSLGLRKIMDGEKKMAEAELKFAIAHIGQGLTQTGIFGILFSLSCLSFTAFLIIGLGQILNGNFWLSSVIVSLTLGLFSGLMARMGLQKHKRSSLTLPQTRQLFLKGKKIHE
jgi:hypothetical protein